MRALRFFLALVAALVFHLILAGTEPAVSRVVDPFLWVIVFQAMRGDLVSAMLAGAVVGLTQDAVTGGLYGLYGFSGTVVGYVLARSARILTLQKPYYVVLFFAAAVLLQQIVLQLLAVTLLQRGEITALAELVLKVAVAGLLGTAVVATVDRVAGRYVAWRRGRRPRVSLE